MKIKNFLDISDLSEGLIRNIISEHTSQKSILNNKSIGLIFEKYSTRTRLSFMTGIYKLGGNPIEIKFQDLNISRQESFEDTFKAMNCYLDGLVYRTADHNNLIEASKYFKKPIINALSDISHPCQTISDLYTLNKHFGNLKINILWIGDMNNVCFSLVQAVNFLQEIKLTICSPKEITKNISWHMNKNILIKNDISQIDLSKIKCVMTDVFISMNDKNAFDKSIHLTPYAVDNSMISKMSKDIVFMHCLPANVGQEVTKDVINGSHSIVWEQAKNRMVAQNNLFNYFDW